MISERHKKILTAEICPYCSSQTNRTTEKKIYGKEYSGGDVIVCNNYPKCDSYVGCHKTGEPLGRLANKELRGHKRLAHSAFDKLWETGKMKRGEAYKELSEYLNIPEEYTHIGMFSIRTCKKVVEFSIERLLND